MKSPECSGLFSALSQIDTFQTKQMWSIEKGME